MAAWLLLLLSACGWCSLVLNTGADASPQVQVQVDMASNHVSVWQPGHRKFALEPKFVARPGASEEDDGWLLTVMFDSGGEVPAPAHAWLSGAW